MLNEASGDQEATFLMLRIYKRSHLSTYKLIKYFHPLALECLIHPSNPHVPTLNGSYRYFEAETMGGMKLAWHGGGHDLKPVYIVEEVGKNSAVRE